MKTTESFKSKQSDTFNWFLINYFYYYVLKCVVFSLTVSVVRLVECVFLGSGNVHSDFEYLQKSLPWSVVVWLGNNNRSFNIRIILLPLLLLLHTLLYLPILPLYHAPIIYSKIHMLWLVHMQYYLIYCVTLLHKHYIHSQREVIKNVVTGVFVVRARGVLQSE